MATIGRSRSSSFLVPQFLNNALRTVVLLWWNMVADDSVLHRRALTLQFAFTNVVAVGLLSAAWGRGWIQMLWKADVESGGYLASAIAVVFVFGLCWATRLVNMLDREATRVAIASQGRLDVLPSEVRKILMSSADARELLLQALRLEYVVRISPVKNIANSLVFLGLVGTVIGFIVALSGVDPDGAADVSLIGKMVSTLIAGMSIALYTTLVGSLLHLWLIIISRQIESGTIRLLTSILRMAGDGMAGDEKRSAS